MSNAVTARLEALWAPAPGLKGLLGTVDHKQIGKRYIVTVRHGASLSYAAARRGCEQSQDMLALGPSYSLYAVLDFIVDNFFPIVREFREELQELEEEVFQDTFKRETIRRREAERETRAAVKTRRV